MMDTPVNHLFYGDCLDIVQQEIIDKDLHPNLIYLDPPFQSGRDYNMLYKDETGHPLPEQAQAFTDTWKWTPAHQKAMGNIPRLVHEPGPLMGMIPPLQRSQPEMAAYLVYMTERLAILHHALAEGGTLWLHCDPHASHYLKIVLDCIFGTSGFRNEIIWNYRRWPTKHPDFQRMHDVILRYAKGEPTTWNQLYEPVSDSFQKRFKGKANVLDPGATKKRAAEHETPGLPMRDVWNLPILAGSSKERMGYPTQKPLQLLDRVIQTGSNPGDLVLDPFCGCGTTLEAAHHLQRQWIGIDITIHAVRAISRRRLQSRCGLRPGLDFEISGIPNSIESARHLHQRDPFHFQKWAVEEAGGVPSAKRTADGGVDGSIWYYLPAINKRRYGHMILEVKGGTPRRADLRALRGVLERDQDVDMAGLIVSELSPRMRRNWEQEAATVPPVEIGGQAYPALQILTVAELLAGERFETPTRAGDETDLRPQKLF